MLLFFKTGSLGSSGGLELTILQLSVCWHSLHAWLVFSKLYLVVKTDLINTVLGDSEGIRAKHQGNSLSTIRGPSDIVFARHIIPLQSQTSNHYCLLETGSIEEILLSRMNPRDKHITTRVNG